MTKQLPSEDVLEEMDARDGVSLEWSVAERSYRRGCHQTANFLLRLLRNNPGRELAALFAAEKLLRDMRYTAKVNRHHLHTAGDRLRRKGFPGGWGGDRNPSAARNQ